MCGIAGGVHLPLDHYAMSKLSLTFQEAMALRGPDGIGHFQAHNALMVHRRLAIMDRVGGKQPFEDDRYVLIGNGEIYNFKDLIKDHGLTHLPNQSDMAPILPLWHRFGSKAFDLLEGMYAFAIYDKIEQSLVLARDKFGIKPLYYAATEHGLIFASTINALLATNLIEPALNTKAIRHSAQLSFGLGGDTAFNAINRVQPGEVIRFQDNKSKVLTQNHSVKFAVEEGAPSTSLECALLDAVERYTQSEVPIGIFMSSGVDSTIISRALYLLGHRDIAHFTADLDLEGFTSEANGAERNCRINHGQFHRVRITAEDIISHLPDIVAQMDDLNFDPSMIPTYFLAREASKKVGVILGGNGGDEVFAGYGRYAYIHSPTNMEYGFRARARMANSMFRDQGGVSHHRALMSILKAREWPQKLDRLQRRQALDLLSFLPQFHLATFDRQLMRFSLEGRTPLLHEPLMRLGFLAPQHEKTRFGVTKKALRDWLHAQSPDFHSFARKRGFEMPIERVFIGREANVAAYLTDHPGLITLFQRSVIKDLMQRKGAQCSTLAMRFMILALWYDRVVMRSSERYEACFGLRTPIPAITHSFEPKPEGALALG